jgi:hypothetical protein
MVDLCNIFEISTPSRSILSSEGNESLRLLLAASLLTSGFEFEVLKSVVHYLYMSDTRGIFNSLCRCIISIKAKHEYYNYYSKLCIPRSLRKNVSLNMTLI